MPGALPFFALLWLTSSGRSSRTWPLRITCLIMAQALDERQVAEIKEAFALFDKVSRMVARMYSAFVDRLLRCLTYACTAGGHFCCMQRRLPGFVFSSRCRRRTREE